MGLFITTVAAAGGLAVAALGGWVWYTTSVEQPAYTSVSLDGDIEIRDYPGLVVAEVRHKGERYEAVGKGFRSLAGYIFAKNRPGPQIAMTAPVIQRPAEMAATPPDSSGPAAASTTDWTVRFVMPAQYTHADLPDPADNAVRLVTVPPTRWVAIRFSGVTTNELLADREATLRAWMARQGLFPEGPPAFAYYNDPLTPGFLRRNEVLFEIAGP